MRHKKEFVRKTYVGIKAIYIRVFSNPKLHLASVSSSAKFHPFQTQPIFIMAYMKKQPNIWSSIYCYLMMKPL